MEEGGTEVVTVVAFTYLGTPRPVGTNIRTGILAKWWRYPDAQLESPPQLFSANPRRDGLSYFFSILVGRAPEFNSGHRRLLAA